MNQDQNPTEEESVIVDPINPEEHPVDAWKEKHKVVRLITVKSKAKTRHQFIIARPTLSQYDMIMKYMKDDKPHKYRECMIANCIKAGNKKLVENDDDVRNAVFDKIIDMYEKLEVEEKEL